MEYTCVRPKCHCVQPELAVWHTSEREREREREYDQGRQWLIADDTVRPPRWLPVERRPLPVELL